MAEKKYDKYFIKYGINTPKVDDPRPILARVDNAVAKGSNFYLVHWVALLLGVPVFLYLLNRSQQR